MEPTTDGALLGGRLSYRQFRHGYRSGIEPVLLAAAIPARCGERVLEAGCGAGAAMMCLCARISGLCGVGIEADPATAALAEHNWSMNGLTGLTLHRARLPELPRALGRFDHVFANPPWHHARASASPDQRRDLARRARPGLLEDWIAPLARLLLPGGSLTLILPASLHAQASAIMLGAGLGGVVLWPFWPKPGVGARIVLLQARSGAASGGAIGAGLVLHHDGGSFTEGADDILRRGEAIRLSNDSV